MKFYTLLLDGVPRLDITALDADEIGTRAVKMLGAREYGHYRKEGRIKIVKVKLEVMV